MKQGKNRKQRRVVKINGVKIVNSENSRKTGQTEPKIATEGTENLIWLADKDNLEL